MIPKILVLETKETVLRNSLERYIEFIKAKGIIDDFKLQFLSVNEIEDLISSELEFDYKEFQNSIASFYLDFNIPDMLNDRDFSSTSHLCLNSNLTNDIGILSNIFKPYGDLYSLVNKIGKEDKKLFTYWNSLDAVKEAENEEKNIYFFNIQSGTKKY